MAVEGLRTEQRRSDDDCPDAAVARLGMGEGQVGGLASDIATVAGEHVPEVVHVAQAVVEPAAVRIELEIFRLAHRIGRLQQAPGPQPSLLHELGVGPPKAPRG